MSKAMDSQLLACLTLGSTGCGQCQGVSGFNDTMPTWSGLQQADPSLQLFPNVAFRCKLKDMAMSIFNEGEIWQRQALQGR